MKKYLLSSGTSTTDINSYIKDLILLGLRVPERSIPQFNYGSERIISSIEEEEIESSVRNIINRIITNIITNNPEVNLSLTSLYITGNTVVVSISINNTETKYNINL